MKYRLFARRADSGAALDPRSLHALAILLLLTQLPHVLHLPPWVSVMGLGLVALRLWQGSGQHGQRRDRRAAVYLRWLLSPPAVVLFALAGAALLYRHYGYFFGRDPCVAFLFLLVACKYAELRRPGDGTLLLCLAAFLLLTQYFYSQSIVSALVTLPAVLALGNALAVLQNPTSTRTTGTRLRLVARLLLQGAPIAALLFVLFPRLPGPLWSLPDDARTQTGLSDSMTPGDIGRLSLSDAVAFRVEFDDAIPSSAERYWRGPVLEAFDGRRWDALSPRYEATLYDSDPADTIDYTVLLQPHQQRWLFALDQAASLPSTASQAPRDRRVLAQMSADRQLLRNRPVDRLLQYRQSSRIDDRYRSVRPPGPQSLQLPARNTRTIDYAQILRRTLPDDRAFIETVLADFNRLPFRYTLEPQLLGDRPVDEFLFDTREGFCEHYASAFVVLLRAAGIPARVVTGYLGGELNGDYMIVRQSDAHAWAEAWIDGFWIRFDPTAAVSPLRVEQGLASALPASAQVPALARRTGDWLHRLQLQWDAINHAWQRGIVNFNDSTQQRLWQRLGIAQPDLWQLTLLLLALAGGWSLVLLRRQHDAARSVAERYWRRYEALLSARGITRASGETPAQFAARAARRLPGQRDRLQRIEVLLSRLRFQRVDARHARAMEQQVRQQLWRLRWALWRARALSDAVSSPRPAAAD